MLAVGYPWKMLLIGLALLAMPSFGFAEEAVAEPAWKADVVSAQKASTQSANIAWMLTSSALVMLMLPGLALFYGGMARRKNILGTMMHTMVALGIVGVQWVICGYSLAFGESQGGFIGFSPELLFLGVEAATSEKFRVFPATDCPLYLHAMFQGMFAIITVALISGAFAERVKFGAYCLFALIWTTIVYDPLAHWVWAAAWTEDGSGGWLGGMGAMDFAGGTVVHIAAGVSGLAAILLLKKRHGYGKQAFHPNSMVFTLLGAGLLWFGWFGFNGGSGVASNALATSAFTVTQVAAATAGMAWTIVEWLHRGKPTALGFASGVVAGLVAITPASGFVSPSGALLIGMISGVLCYWSVAAKSILGYDDSLDAFGIHGVGGFIGAILTGALCSVPLWRYGTGSDADSYPGTLADGIGAQLYVQVIAALAAAAYAFIVTAILVVVIDKTIGFTVKPEDEAIGLDISQHGEVGMDYGPEVDGAGRLKGSEPKSATSPGVSVSRFSVFVDGVETKQLHHAWSELCKVGENPPMPEFTDVYKHFTTVSGNKFRFRGGDPDVIETQLRTIFNKVLGRTTIQTRIE